MVSGPQRLKSLEEHCLYEEAVLLAWNYGTNLVLNTPKESLRVDRGLPLG